MVDGIIADVKGADIKLTNCEMAGNKVGEIEMLDVKVADNSPRIKVVSPLVSSH